MHKTVLRHNNNKRTVHKSVQSAYWVNHWDAKTNFSEWTLERICEMSLVKCALCIIFRWLFEIWERRMELNELRVSVAHAIPVQVKWQRHSETCICKRRQNLHKRSTCLATGCISAPKIFTCSNHWELPLVFCYSICTCAQWQLWWFQIAWRKRHNFVPRWMFDEEFALACVYEYIEYHWLRI